MVVEVRGKWDGLGDQKRETAIDSEISVFFLIHNGDHILQISSLQVIGFFLSLFLIFLLFFLEHPSQSFWIS